MSTRYLAAVIDDFGAGPGPVLRELPRRVPGAGEIEVAITAASVNPIDVRRRHGYGRRLFSLIGAARLPLTLGNDFAGRVSRVGPGVFHLREGDAVFGAAPPSSHGSHANRIIVRAEHAVSQPAGVACVSLATFPYNYLTVTRAMRGAGLGDGDLAGMRVLVHGATGGLGLLALQMLRRRGALVTATGSAGRLELCRGAGAAAVIDRRREGLRVLRGAGRGFAATLNFANWDDEGALLGLLEAGATGHATTVHPMLGNLDQFGWLRGATRSLRQRHRMRTLAPSGARYAWTVFGVDRAALEELAASAATLIAPDTRTYTLADAASAYFHNEQGLPGRAVLMPDATEMA